MTTEELLQLILNNQTEILENQLNAADIMIVFGNIFLGLILGFIGVRGLTKPWK